MDQALAGDGQAFGRLAGAVQDDLFRLAISQGLTKTDAGEAVQETLLRAWRGRQKWISGRDAVAWLAGIAMNVVRERRRRRPMAVLDPALLAAAEMVGGDAETDAVDLGELAGAMAALAPRQREAVTCRYLLRMSVRETALTMGCAEGTVKAAVAAALANLRKHIDSV